MSFSVLRTELVTDPLGKGYLTKSDQECYESLVEKNRTKYITLTSAQLLAWSGMNLRKRNIKNASLSHPNEDIKNICDVASLFLERDETSLDLNNPIHSGMVDALVMGGVLTNSDKADLYLLATVKTSRFEELGIPEYHPGDINLVRS
jgi:hypothetical protein